ncbi:serine/threonine protein kinase [Metabacillus fastidiosus]|uniref:serine/threonine protein kinase n=1 Tax=Metabacillus fastidiosus TaxID=1458 RepID=UPI002E1FB9AD|nr:protein kinase [Metabacillus fastidiosus]MED4452989.1 protein kinase [Metabacillus fastidiosus]
MKEGTVLSGRYEILKVIGMGSYGIVYQCRDMKTKEKKVLKQLRPSKRRSKKEIALFQNETSILHTLHHENMPILYDNFSENGYLFYVMSLIEGDNLEDEIFFHKKTFNEKEALFLLADLLELVDYLHQKDIYHQDLRIPNILMKNKQLFLIDFGLSKQGDLVQQNDNVKMKQQDYYDLGEILLYLLYTTYTSKNKKALPWTEELSLEKETVHLLKRLLEIEEPYSNAEEISADLYNACKRQEKVI